MEPLFSIVVPAYNVRPFLEGCLRSIRAQTVPDWECICVDDGSTDESGTVLDEFAAQDARFRAIHQANAGVGPARNAALSRCRGRFVAFVDADDVLHPRFLETVASTFERHPDAEFCRVEMADFFGPEPDWDDDENPEAEVRDLSSRVDEDSFEGYLWQFIFRREAIAGLAFRNLRYGEDRLFYAAVLDRAKRAAFSGAVRYGYRHHAESTVASPMTASKFSDYCRYHRECIRIMDQSAKQYDRHCYRTIFHRFAVRNATSFFRGMAPGERDSAFPVWMEAMSALSEAKGFSRSERIRLRLASRIRRQWTVWILFHGRTWLVRYSPLRRTASFAKWKVAIPAWSLLRGCRHLPPGA